MNKLSRFPSLIQKLYCACFVKCLPVHVVRPKKAYLEIVALVRLYAKRTVSAVTKFFVTVLHSN